MQARVQAGAPQRQAARWNPLSARSAAPGGWAAAQRGAHHLPRGSAPGARPANPHKPHPTRPPQVTVTSHAASPAQPSLPVGAASGAPESWRVLRFGDCTRQSVSRVGMRYAASGDGGGGGGGGGRQGPRLAASPDCLAQQDLKTAAALVAALLGLHHLLPCTARAAGAAHTGPLLAAAPALRVLVLGLGGGGLPLFLAHHFPQAGALRLGS